MKFHNLRFQSVDRSLCRLRELLRQDTLFTLSKVVASVFMENFLEFDVVASCIDMVSLIPYDISIP